LLEGAVLDTHTSCHWFKSDNNLFRKTTIYFRNVITCANLWSYVKIFQISLFITEIIEHPKINVWFSNSVLIRTGHSCGSCYPCHTHYDIVFLWSLVKRFLTYISDHKWKYFWIHHYSDTLVNISLIITDIYYFQYSLIITENIFMFQKTCLIRSENILNISDHYW